MSKFITVVEEIQNLSLQEKEEVFFLLNQYLVNDKMDDIFKYYLESRKRKNLKFSKNIKELKSCLDD